MPRRKVTAKLEGLPSPDRAGYWWKYNTWTKIGKAVLVKQWVHPDTWQVYHPGQWLPDDMQEKHDGYLWYYLGPLIEDGEGDDGRKAIV